MKKEIETFYRLKRRINTVRHGIWDVKLSINDVRKWCRDCKEDWDKQSDIEKQRLKGECTTILSDMEKALVELKEARRIMLDGITSME